MDTGRLFGHRIAVARGNGGWPSAVAVLSKQVAAGVQVDVLHSNAILSSFSDSLPARVVATWLVTVQLLQWMGCVAVRSDTRSFNIARSHVVQGHSTQGGRWEIASFLLEKQKHCALDMSMVSIGCSADAFAKTARWMDAMLCLTTRPNVVIFGSVVAASSWTQAMCLVRLLLTRGLELSPPLIGAIEMLLPWQRSLQTRSSLKAFNAGLSNLDWNHALQQLNTVRPRTDEQESIISSDSSTWQILLHSRSSRFVSPKRSLAFPQFAVAFGKLFGVLRGQLDACGLRPWMESRRVSAPCIFVNSWISVVKGSA
eukprot:symbB.v1.2.013890.t1/scaffold997.1/size145858/9